MWRRIGRGRAAGNVTLRHDGWWKTVRVDGECDKYQRRHSLDGDAKVALARNSLRKFAGDVAVNGRARRQVDVAVGNEVTLDLTFDDGACSGAHDDVAVNASLIGDRKAGTGGDVDVPLYLA